MKFRLLFLFGLLCNAANALCPDGYYENTIDLNNLNRVDNGIWQSIVSTYTSYSYTSQGLTKRCEGYDVNLDGNWFGTDEGGTCLDCRFDNMVHGDWYVEFDPEISGFTTLRGTSACISTVYANNMNAYQSSDSVSPSNGQQSGSSCWCKLLSIDEIEVDAKWIYDGSNGHWGASTCFQECAQTCASEARKYQKMREALFNGVNNTSVVHGCTALNQKIYNISYDLSGGVNYSDAPFCYKITSGDIVLKSPTKSGDVFLNWVDNNNLVIESIIAGTMGDLHLTAKWNSDKTCSAGEYWYETNCVNVGAGYYSADGDVNRYKCPQGLTTIGFGLGADEIGDCGHILHVGEHKIYLRSIKNTTPSIYFMFDDQIFYGSMSEQPIGIMRIMYNDKEYTVYDDSMLK